MYLLPRVFFSTTSADCSCCSLWGKKKLCPYETVVLEQWILPHRTLLFHCYLAQSDISLPCGLFAAQVHHLTYVGIFKQIFSCCPRGLLNALHFLKLFFFFFLFCFSDFHPSVFQFDDLFLHIILVKLLVYFWFQYCIHQLFFGSSIF